MSRLDLANLAARRAKVEKAGVTDADIKAGAQALPNELIGKEPAKVYDLAEIKDVLRPRGPGEMGARSYDVFRNRVAYEENQVIAVPIAKLVDNPFNPRFFYSEDSIAEISADLAQNKQLMPVLICVAPDMEHFILIDGLRRKKGLLRGNKATVNAVVIDLSTNEELYRYAYALNNQREQQTPFDNALAWQKLLDEGVVHDNAGIERLTKTDKGTVSKVLSLAKLPMPLLTKMHANADKFGLSLAYEISLFHNARGEEATMKLIDKVIIDKLGYRDVERIRKSKVPVDGESLSKKTRKRYDHQYDLNLSGKKIGQMKSYNNGRIDVNLQNLPDETREKFIEGIQKLIASLA